MSPPSHLSIDNPQHAGSFVTARFNETETVVKRAQAFSESDFSGSEIDSPADTPTIETFPRMQLPGIVDDERPNTSVIDNFSKVASNLQRDFEGLAGNMKGMMGVLEQGRKMMQGMAELGNKLNKAQVDAARIAALEETVKTVECKAAATRTELEDKIAKLEVAIAQLQTTADAQRMEPQLVNRVPAPGDIVLPGPASLPAHIETVCQEKDFDALANTKAHTSTKPATACGAAIKAWNKMPDQVIGQSASDTKAVVDAAMPINDIQTVTYPEGISPPIDALNKSAASGKHRYDRDFLLQFSKVCTTTPKTEESLEVLGIDKDNTNVDMSFPRSRGTARGASRGAPTIACGEGSIRGRNIRGKMETFGSGVGGLSNAKESEGTQSPNALGPMTSAKQLPNSTVDIDDTSDDVRSLNRIPLATIASAAPPRDNIALSAAQQGHRSKVAQGKGSRLAEPESTTISEPVSGNAGPGKAKDLEAKPFIHVTAPDRSVAVHDTATSVGLQTQEAVDCLSPLEDVEMVVNKILCNLFDRLNPSNVSSISTEIVDLVNKSTGQRVERILSDIARQTFHRGIGVFNATLYAALCRQLWLDIAPSVCNESRIDSDTKPLRGPDLFRKYLLDRCQQEIEATARKNVACMGGWGTPGDRKNHRTCEIAEFGIQRTRLETVEVFAFIGELFNHEIVSTRIIHSAVLMLLSDVDTPRKVDVESVCRLLRVVGAKIQAQPRMAEQMQSYVGMMRDMIRSEHLDDRLKKKVRRVIELQSRNWQFAFGELTCRIRLPSESWSHEQSHPVVTH